MPSISDPGYRIVNLALQKGIKIDIIPGVSAVLTALVLSGLPVSSFNFRGFPPRKSAALAKFLQIEMASHHTLIVFESPFRVEKLMEAIKLIDHNRKCAVCIELTKFYERIHRGNASEIIEQLKTKKVKGEATIVISGAP